MTGESIDRRSSERDRYMQYRAAALIVIGRRGLDHPLGVQAADVYEWADEHLRRIHTEIARRYAIGEVTIG